MDALQDNLICATIVPKDGWAMCPNCGHGKFFAVLPDTVVKNLSCKCKRCKLKFLITVEPEPETKESSA